MRRLLGLGALAGGAWLLGGCELAEVTISPSEEVLVVEATLRAGEPIQRVLLHRSLYAGEESADAGAEVSVTTESGRVVPFQLASQDACTRGLAQEQQTLVAARTHCFLSTPASASWVEPGKTYALSVRTPDGRVVHGRTTVPGDFRLVSPHLPAPPVYTCRIPPHTSLPLVWTVAEGAWIYLTVLVIHGLDAALAGTGVKAPGRLELTSVVVSARDTTITLPAGFGVFDRLDLDRDLLLAIRDGFPQGTNLELLVAAADRNHANTRHGGGFNPSGDVRISSVVGDGVGHFGSLVPLQLRIVVTDDDGAPPPCAPGSGPDAPTRLPACRAGPSASSASHHPGRAADTTCN